MIFHHRDAENTEKTFNRQESKETQRKVYNLGVFVILRVLRVFIFFRKIRTIRGEIFFLPPP